MVWSIGKESSSEGSKGRPRGTAVFRRHSAADQCGEEGISQRRRQQSAVHKQAAIDGEKGAKFSQGCCVRERDFRQAMYLSTKT